MKHKATGFFVEFRLHGYARRYAEDLIREVSRVFHVKCVRHVVPHITLYGPATTSDIRQVVSTVQRIGQKYTLVPFTIKGFGYFTHPSKVIYLDIDPSPELKNLRWELSEALQQISTCQPFDKTKEFGFHSTIALRIPDNKFNQIWNYINQKKHLISNNISSEPLSSGIRGEFYTNTT